MKYVYYYISLFLVLLCSAYCRAQDTSLLMVHFGTTYDDTRQKTINAINEKARKEFPDMIVREAYTSRIVMNRLAKQGIRKDTPTEALLRLRSEGVRTVKVQPSYVIDGIEMDRLRKEIEQVRPFFDSIWVSTPLLYSVEDAGKVCEIMVNRHPADNKQREHVLFIGHGTEGPATALYSQLDYMLRAAGHANYHVATIEGYPTQEMTLKNLKQNKVKKVQLRPLLLTAGDHARNDIAKEWKGLFEQQGFEVNVKLQGLGEIKAIRDIYIQHIKVMLK